MGIRISMFLGLSDPDPLLSGMDPDPDLPFSHKGIEWTEKMFAK
jgi:hypothetical protein